METNNTLRIIPFCSHKPDKYDDPEHAFYSNWAQSPFQMNNVHFHSVEQYMMYEKALLFGDTEVAKTVMSLDYETPDGLPDERWDSQLKEIKALGRKVNGFDSKVWDAKCYGIVLIGVAAKFKQNKEHLAKLIETNDALICEAASYDKIWGIGMNRDDPRVQNPLEWQGKNLLGDCIMFVRNASKASIK